MEIQNGESLILISVLLCPQLFDEAVRTQLCLCSNALHSAVRLSKRRLALGHGPTRSSGELDFSAIDHSDVEIGEKVLSNLFSRKERKKYWRACRHLLVETGILLLGLRPATLLDQCASLAFGTLQTFCHEMGKERGPPLAVCQTKTSPLLVRRDLLASKLEAAVYATQCMLSLKQNSYVNICAKTQNALLDICAIRTMSIFVPCGCKLGRIGLPQVSYLSWTHDELFRIKSLFQKAQEQLNTGMLVEFDGLVDHYGINPPWLTAWMCGYPVGYWSCSVGSGEPSLVTVFKVFLGSKVETRLVTSFSVPINVLIKCGESQPMLERRLVWKHLLDRLGEEWCEITSQKKGRETHHSGGMHILWQEFKRCEESVHLFCETHTLHLNKILL